MRFLGLLLVFGLFVAISPAQAAFFNKKVTLYPENRNVKNFHPYQWSNTVEGNDIALIDVDAIIKNALTNGIIRQIAIQGEIGYVEVYDLFKDLSFRDKNLIAHSIHSLYKGRKGKQYNLFLIKDRDDNVLGSSTRYGLDLY